MKRTYQFTLAEMENPLYTKAFEFGYEQGYDDGRESIVIEQKAALKPDPETGLVPCGCGGKAKFRFGMDWKGRPDDSCFVICEECGEQSGTVCGECIARHFWNRAMSGGKDNG